MEKIYLTMSVHSRQFLVEYLSISTHCLASCVQVLQEMSSPAKILQETTEYARNVWSANICQACLKSYILADSVLYVPPLQDSCKKCMGVRLGNPHRKSLHFKWNKYPLFFNLDSTLSGKIDKNLANFFSKLHFLTNKSRSSNLFSAPGNLLPTLWNAH